MAGRLAGKIALISGEPRMGGASSRLFAAEGAKVGVVDRNEEAGRAVVHQDSGRHGRVRLRGRREEGGDAVRGRHCGAARAPRAVNHAGSIIIKPFLKTRSQSGNG